MRKLFILSIFLVGCGAESGDILTTEKYENFVKLCEPRGGLDYVIFDEYKYGGLFENSADIHCANGDLLNYSNRCNYGCDKE